MGIKTFAEFKTDLAFEIHRDDLTAKLGGWINTAYMTLTTKNKIWTIRGLEKSCYFPELEDTSTDSTIDGVAYIDVPTGCFVIRTIWDSTNDKKLTKINWRQYEDYTGRADTTQEGIPDEYCRYGNKIYLHKTPDDEYTENIYFRKRITLLSLTTDTLAIGAEWDEPTLQLTAIQTHMRLDEFDKAEAKKKEWIELVSGIMGIYKQEELDRDDLLKPSYEYLEGFKYRT